MLEALSSGTVILASHTGGNKYFEKYGAKGIKLFETADEAIEIIESLLLLGHEPLKELAENNRIIYEEEYTVKKFAERYISLWKSLYCELDKTN